MTSIPLAAHSVRKTQNNNSPFQVALLKSVVADLFWK
jgi:hypothetical protein